MLENNMNRILIILTFLVVGHLAVAEKIYKWVDENGQIHYSSSKPANQPVETMKVKKGPKVTATTRQTETAEKKPANQADDADADAAAKAQLAKTDAANKRRLCEQSRNNVAALNATVRVSRIDEKTGKTVRMNDAQRLQSMKAAQQGIKEYCQ